MNSFAAVTELVPRIIRSS